tara:strand:+ start:755 stop:1006 length:252 start_codon:yes stop_codon:yes gene_type:complete
MKKKIKSDKTCPECDHDPIDHFFEGRDYNMYRKRMRDRKLAKEYCEEHEMMHSNTRCKPVWKECCGILDGYTVEIKKFKKKQW